MIEWHSKHHVTCDHPWHFRAFNQSRVLGCFDSRLMFASGVIRHQATKATRLVTSIYFVLLMCHDTSTVSCTSTCMVQHEYHWVWEACCDVLMLNVCVFFFIGFRLEIEDHKLPFHRRQHHTNIHLALLLASYVPYRVLQYSLATIQSWRSAHCLRHPLHRFRRSCYVCPCWVERHNRSLLHHGLQRRDPLDWQYRRRCYQNCSLLLLLLAPTPRGFPSWCYSIPNHGPRNPSEHSNPKRFPCTPVVRPSTTTRTWGISVPFWPTTWSSAPCNTLDTTSITFVI